MRLPTEPREPDVGTPEDWAQIEQALGLKGFDAWRRERLWRQIRSIFNLYLSPGDPPDVRPSNYGRALEALRRHAVRLFVDLSPSGRLEGSGDSASDDRTICDDPDNLPADGLGDLDLWALAYLSRAILPTAKRRALLDGLVELIEAADESREALPRDKGGRPSDWRLQAVIHLLARLYAQWAGKKPGISRDPMTAQPSGPFFRFVKTCLRTFTSEPARCDEALAKTIQRVLKVKHWRIVLA